MENIYGNSFICDTEQMAKTLSVKLNQGGGLQLNCYTVSGTMCYIGLSDNGKIDERISKLFELLSAYHTADRKVADLESKMRQCRTVVKAQEGLKERTVKRDIAEVAGASEGGDAKKVKK